MKKIATLLFAVFALAVSANAADEKIRVLIVDGQNNHNWKDTSPFLEKQLEASGRFDVDISTSPNENAPQTEWGAWRPKFSDYDVVLSNFNNRKTKDGKLSEWPGEVQQAFEKYISGGRGLVNVHAANNAHKGWSEFEKMTGLLWRSPKDGIRLALDKYGDRLRMPVGEGPGAGHGPRYPYQVEIRDSEHPITKGMPKVFMHPEDELYHGQRGPAENITILATAFASEEKKGTGAHEPMLWWIPYGEGRAVTCVLGHVGGNSNPNESPAMRDIAFLTIIKRSLEWAAGKEVTTRIPDNFPTADEVSLIEAE
jgi:type 1 glutamine amidotransferase